MANFIYTAKNKQGRIVEGSIDDLDLDSAVASLQSKDLVVLSIKKEGKKTAAGRTRQKRLRRRVTADDLTLFAGQMHALLEAGVPL